MITDTGITLTYKEMDTYTGKSCKMDCKQENSAQCVNESQLL